MTIDTNRDIVEAGITAIYQSGWRKGYQAGVKSFNEQTKLILPLMYSILFIFSAGVLGARFSPTLPTTVAAAGHQEPAGDDQADRVADPRSCGTTCACWTSATAGALSPIRSGRSSRTSRSRNCWRSATTKSA